MNDGQISDLSPLSTLTNLQWLRLRGSHISDVSPLSSLSGLLGVDLERNPLNRTAYCHDLQAVLDANPMMTSAAMPCLYFDTPNPNPPGAVSASDGTYTDKVAITWEALCAGPGGSDTFQYMVYRSASLEGAKEAISGWLNATSFDDTTVSPGVHYYYWLKSNHSTDFSTPDEGFAAGGTPQVPPEKSLVIFENDAEVRSDFRFNKANLQYDSSHPDVKKLQVILKHEGFFPVSTAFAERYGPATRAGVMLLQKDRGLVEQDGIVGDATITELNRILDAKCTREASRASLIAAFARQFCHDFLPDHFPPELVLAIAAQESGGIDFDNMYVRDDCGRGIMQITSDEYFRAGSGMDCAAVDCIKCSDVTSGGRDCTGYYTNAVCGIETNIKDGLYVLKDKYYHRCPRGTEVIQGLEFTCEDFETIHTVWKYNGRVCFPTESSRAYLKNVSDKFEHLDLYFPGITYANADHLIDKLRLASNKQLLAKLCSPGALSVIDSVGRVTGLVSGQQREEIPCSIYDAPNETVIVFFSHDSTLTYRVSGASQGVYALSVESTENGTSTLFQANGISTAQGAVHEYRVEWDALSGGQQGVVLKVDSEGDGSFEQTITAGPVLERPQISVNGLVGVSSTRPALDRRTGQFSVNVTATNKSTTVIGSPVWLVIDSVSSLWVIPVNTSGTTADGKWYFDLSSLLGDGKLDPGEAVSQRVNFGNPGRLSFTFKSSVRGVVSP